MKDSRNHTRTHVLYGKIFYSLSNVTNEQRRLNTFESTHINYARPGSCGIFARLNRRDRFLLIFPLFARTAVHGLLKNVYINCFINMQTWQKILANKANENLKYQTEELEQIWGPYRGLFQGDLLTECAHARWSSGLSISETTPWSWISDASVP